MGWRNFPAELWMLCCVEARLYLPQMRWRYMDCSTAASMDSTNMLHMSENWVHQGLNRQVNVVGFFAMLASFNVLTQREVLNLFIPHLSWAMEGYPHQRQVHSGQHDKLCLPDIGVCQNSVCLSLQMPFQEKIYLLVPLAVLAACL